MSANKKAKPVKPQLDDVDGGELSPANYEKIGRSIESVVIHGHYSTKRLFIFNTLRGVFFGIGSAVGATVVLVLLVWIFNAFSEIPLIGDLFESAQDTVEQINSTTP